MITLIILTGIILLLRSLCGCVTGGRGFPQPCDTDRVTVRHGASCGDSPQPSHASRGVGGTRRQSHHRRHKKHARGQNHRLRDPPPKLLVPTGRGGLPPKLRYQKARVKTGWRHARYLVVTRLASRLARDLASCDRDVLASPSLPESGCALPLNGTLGGCTLYTCTCSCCRLPACCRSFIIAGGECRNISFHG